MANPPPPRSESRRGLGANAVLDLTVCSALGTAILGLRAIGPAGTATADCPVAEESMCRHRPDARHGRALDTRRRES
jgi:hypothetical protein